MNQGTMSPLPEILEHLQQLQIILADVQHQVQQNIQKVELVLKGRR